MNASEFVSRPIRLHLDLNEYSNGWRTSNPSSSFPLPLEQWVSVHVLHKRPCRARGRRRDLGVNWLIPLPVHRSRGCRSRTRSSQAFLWLETR